jgi:putative flippase GtrA
MAVLWFALTIAGAVFDLAQASAAVAAMTSNFFLNNLFTYRDRRLRGLALLRGPHRNEALSFSASRLGTLLSRNAVKTT